MRLSVYTSCLVIILSINTISQDVEKEWLTKFEYSNFLETARYEESLNLVKKIADASPYAMMKSIGISPQGRSIECVIVSKGHGFTPEEVKDDDAPVILILNAIHSGEINGKDASTILLREILITKEKISLIDNVVLLVIPIFSVDSHERFSAFNRINQIGPKEMGWRTTAQNLNLNRDFMKADAPEMQALLKLYSEWLPDFLIDVHATDGSDFQYQTTYAIEKHENTTPMISNWVKNIFNPYIVDAVNRKGFSISPFVGMIKGDPRNGIYDWVPLPRFSNGYVTLQNRPGLLIESHILKTYKERVYSTKAVIESVIELLNQKPDDFLSICEESDDYVNEMFIEEGKSYPVSFKRTDESTVFRFEGIDYDFIESKVAGKKVRIFNGKKYSAEVPYYNKAVADKTITVPVAYIIPREWSIIVDRIKLHGIEVEFFNEKKQYKVERYKFFNVRFPSKPYEGHFNPEFDYVKNEDTVTVQIGDCYISTDQRAPGIIINLLEPDADDSFVRWGFFNSIFERAEYYEDYALQPIAEEMYSNNKKVKAEFQAKLRSDSVFADSPRQRLDFFYEKTPYYDDHYNIYPVLRVVEEIDD
ncbi:MAG: M14 family metallopeptidase [Melioribacteraceae bacterium]|nr:M14 family metallopeptidase [Melioribacteraceae bacterium]